MKGTPVRDLGSISYSAAIESAAHKDTDLTPSEFAARVEREATRRGFDRAARQAVLGDGARWIWNLTDEHFPDAVQIVTEVELAHRYLRRISIFARAARSALGTQSPCAPENQWDFASCYQSPEPGYSVPCGLLSNTLYSDLFTY